MKDVEKTIEIWRAMLCMVKSELREAGYAEDTKYQKGMVITPIWVVTTLSMIALVFVFTFQADIWKYSGNDFFDFLDDLAFMLNQIFRQWKFAVYLILWVLILTTLFFMTKRELREQKLAAPGVAPKRRGKYILRLVLALLLLVAFFYLLVLVSEVPPNKFLNAPTPGIAAGALGVILYLVCWEFLYIAAKLVTTLFVCHDKKSGIKLKILQGTAMPVCSSQEAITTWHIVVSYLMPFVFMYSVLLGLCASAQDSGQLFQYIAAAIFMSFFLAYDLTLVLYVVYMKIRYKMDYISIDRHIYEVTLFKKSYVKTADK